MGALYRKTVVPQTNATLLAGTTANRPPTLVRPEIQALRALAVLGVLVFHLWPLRLPGGYVGVDVFFVVSGFLITDHLVREMARTGRISLPAFWARRARRLLPASLLVLLVTVLAIWLWVPEQRWSQFGGEIISSAFYVENWALAAQSVDYMALSNVKSPVQHFWSLGVEEQFYLIWPLLVIVGAVLWKASRRDFTAGVAIVVAVATGASLVYSIALTFSSPSVAYFSTFTRAWEFGLGALLALALRRIPIPFPPALAAVVSWIGFAALAASMLLFTAETPFPSYTALLPVLGTVAVIAAGSPRRIFAPTAAFSVKPVQWVGDISYGAYLWHWPLVVLFPYALGYSIDTAAAVSILLISLALGWASKRFVEDPLRRTPLLARTRPRWTLLAALLAMALVSASAFPLASHHIAAPLVSEADESECFGAQSMSSPACGDPENAELIASLASFSIDLPPEEVLACERSKSTGTFARCDFGPVPASGPHVALIGDSHAVRLAEPLRSAVDEAGGTLSTFLVSGCPVASPALTGSAWGYDEGDAQKCRDITTRIYDEVVADTDIGVVVLMNRTRLYVSDDENVRPLRDVDVQASIRRLQSADKRVIVVKDHPEMYAQPPQQGGSAPDCLAHAQTPSVCSLPRGEAAFDDPMINAAAATGASIIDLDALFCTPERCLSQIGGVVVYSDDNHMTRSFAMSLVPFLRGQLAPLL